MRVISLGTSVVCQAHLSGSQNSAEPIANRLCILLRHPYNLHGHTCVSSLRCICESRDLIYYPSPDCIVQDHRFDLVQDFGCSASVHPSSPALILIWLPPLIICSISFYFSGRFASCTTETPN